MNQNDDKNDKRAFQLAWLDQNGTTDKDEVFKKSEQAQQAQQTETKKKQKRNPPHAHKKTTSLEEHVDCEVDLHGFGLEDAMVEVSLQIESLRYAGYTSMRIIHGYSNPSRESIRSALLHHLKTKWNRQVERFYQEPHNPGATCVILKAPK